MPHHLHVLSPGSLLVAVRRRYRVVHLAPTAMSQDDASWEVLRDLEQESAGRPPSFLPLADTLAPSSPQLALPVPGVVAEDVPLPVASLSVPPPQADPAAGQVAAQAPPPGELAIAAEAWAELVCLEDDVRRQHMHWVHVHTKSPNDKQPSAFSRESFFEHLVTCYKEVHPEPSNTHGSILMFGAVAKELVQHEHHHAPVFCSKRHMWKAVAEISYRKYKVKLHVKAHSGYATMYLSQAAFSFVCCCLLFFIFHVPGHP